jgi:hypothetical protein
LTRPWPAAELDALPPWTIGRAAGPCAWPQGSAASWPLRLAARGRRWLAGDGTPGAAMEKGQRRKKAHSIDMYQGQNSHFHMWVSHVKSVEPLSCNKSWTEWHTRQRILGAWHIGTWKIFHDRCVIDNFLIAYT